MMAQRIGMGVAGPGFVAVASHRRGAPAAEVDVVDVVEELVNDPAIHVVHNTTPSYKMSKAFLEIL